MHTPRSGYGAPEPQSAVQSLVRVDTFVTHRQARGGLVFHERIEAARITEDLLAERHSEAVDLFAALEGHAVRTKTTPGEVPLADRGGLIPHSNAQS
ncbi:hypothetical protein NOU13_24395 [Rhodococcus erythropolis]|uniref:hypothetical protein n=1 Tax=Rhodococcus erythropolis TaxID=1833 RepID=UPI00210CF0C9|nr:hypothetical protein [Rhodococcus erythropolis]MCQ4127645.1 hypothetical protein [Rhodococcus erythropolis]